jgi:alpha-tubulin suppressor-like RCC1 family protein
MQHPSRTFVFSLFAFVSLLLTLITPAQAQDATWLPVVASSPVSATNLTSASPAPIAPAGATANLLTNIQAIAAGGGHTCALTMGGGVKCWGHNRYGQLGDGATTNRQTPVDVSGLSSGVQAIAAGNDHTCALTTDGSVKCWGYNYHGQLGDGTNTDRLTPVEVNGLGSGVRAIATGGLHTCALTTGGGVKCWGHNWYGQLGDGTNEYSLTPVEVSRLGSGVQAIDAGEWHICALTTGGGVKCWGRNDVGQLGDGTMGSDRLTPVAVSGLGSGTQAIAAGELHTCALITGSGVKCWGHNSFGQLGDGTTTDRLTPVDVSGVGSGVQAIAAGSIHTCALTTGGGVKCWGNNWEGQLGDRTRTERWTPVDVSRMGSGVQAIAAGGAHTCALVTGGGVKCWGGNRYGQLGDGTTTYHLTSVDVSGIGSGVQATATGGHYTCALTTGGGVKCWGGNRYGILGDGTTTDRWTPVEVSRLGSGVQAIAAGGGTPVR